MNFRQMVGVSISAALVLGFGQFAPGAIAKEPEAKSLRAVTLLFRHSVISPKYNPPKVKADWPMGARQLTSIGIRDMYLRGQKLRRKYVDELGLISETYRMSEVYVRASNTDRALQSAQMLVLGLYPMGTGSNPDKSLTSVPSPVAGYTPVPIHSVALENDKVLRPWTKAANCRRYRDYVKKFPLTKLYRTKGKEFEGFLNRVAGVSGYNEGENPSKILYEINEISEPLSSMMAHRMPVPESLEGKSFDMMSELADWNYHYQFLGKPVGRITGGPFVAETIDNFSAYIRAKGKARKFFLYSGHQRTILGVDAALGIETARTKGKLFKGRVPPLGSHYAFELHESSKGAYAIRVRFIADDGERVVRIPGCDRDMCPFDAFKRSVADAIPADWRKECGN